MWVITRYPHMQKWHWLTFSIMRNTKRTLYSYRKLNTSTSKSYINCFGNINKGTFQRSSTPTCSWHGGGRIVLSQSSQMNGCSYQTKITLIEKAEQLVLWVTGNILDVRSDDAFERTSHSAYTSPGWDRFIYRSSGNHFSVSLTH